MSEEKPPPEEELPEEGERVDDLVALPLDEAEFLPPEVADPDETVDNVENPTGDNDDATAS